MKLKKYSDIISRRKVDADGIAGDSNKLARVLGLVDLVFIGVGSTLGLGVYVLAGAVAKETAGPAVAISFLIAAVASGLAGICYAEFASRVPKAGSAYIYCYVTVGEFAAFVIGWNLVLEYAIGIASVSKGLSLYLDNSIDYMFKNTLQELFPMNISFLAPYPDVLASGVVIVLTILLSYGVKESSVVNNIFTVVNLTTVAIVVIFGLFKANTHNWAISSNEALNGTSYEVKQIGEGGYIPFGWTGIMAGAAKCFYAFVGFDVVATTGEEAKNPKRDIPLAIVLSLVVIFFTYFSISCVLTLMLPYFDQDKETPLVSAFQAVNMGYLEYIIRFGAISALSASLLMSIFPLPRILYAMAEDGLIYKFLSQTNDKTQTPVVATLLSGSLAAILSGIFNLEQLMDMLSIGTLLAYTIVTYCILLIRHRESNSETTKLVTVLQKNRNGVMKTNSKCGKLTNGPMSYFKTIFNLLGEKHPTEESVFTFKIALNMFCVCAFLLCSSVDLTENFSKSVTYKTIIFSSLCLLFYIILARQPQLEDDENETINFKVPLVPFLPCISIVVNMYLMTKLDMATWIRFVIWLTIGFIIYVTYSVKNSVQGQRNKTTNISNGLPEGLDEYGKKVNGNSSDNRN